MNGIEKFRGGKVMEIYSVDNSYVGYLHGFDSKVLLNVGAGYSKSRKYVGCVIEMNGWKYFIPLSSWKPNDYELVLGVKRIKKDSVPLIRVTDPTRTRLYSTLQINNMIPVPKECLIFYDVSLETDAKYKMLMLSEISFIKSNEPKITKNAQLIYKQRKNNEFHIGYIRNTVDFQLLEEKADEWCLVNSHTK